MININWGAEMKMVAENSLADIDTRFSYLNKQILYYMNTQIITFDFSSKISETLVRK